MHNMMLSRRHLPPTEHHIMYSTLALTMPHYTVIYKRLAVFSPGPFSIVAPCLQYPYFFDVVKKSTQATPTRLALNFPGENPAMVRVIHNVHMYILLLGPAL